MSANRFAQIIVTAGIFIMLMSLYFEMSSLQLSTASSPVVNNTNITSAAGTSTETSKADTLYNHTIVTINGERIIADLAITSEQQMLGLSGRENMSEDHGMLFIFSSEDRHAFWMKDMKFPIDIIWIDANHTIVHIEQSLPTCNLTEACPVYSPSVNSLYVLETSAGYSLSHDIHVGTQVIINSSNDSPEEQYLQPHLHNGTSCQFTNYD